MIDSIQFSTVTAVCDDAELSAVYGAPEHPARQVFNSIRRQFRHGDKSANKLRFPRADDHDLRAAFDAMRQQRAELTLGRLRARDAPPAEMRQARVGNCWEMACVAAEEARQRGLKSAVWGFLHDGAFVSHNFAVIEMAPHQEGEHSRAPATTHTDFSDCQGLWVVDPWAGICCAAPDYDRIFIAKMLKWSCEGKHILGDHGWHDAMDTDWLETTINSPRVRMSDAIVSPGAIRA